MTAAPVTILDVSAANGAIDWSRVRASVAPRIDATAVKATEGAAGNGSTDTRGAANLEGSLGVGLPTIAYHFLSAWSEPEAQAAHFLATIRPYLPRLSGLMLDVERGGGAAGKYAPAAFVPRFLDALHAGLIAEPPQGLDLPIAIYSASYVEAAMRWMSLPADDIARLRALPLWVAAYTEREPPVCPPWGAWSDPDGGCWAWQWTGSGRVDGVPGACDLSRAKGLLGAPPGAGMVF